MLIDSILDSTDLKKEDITLDWIYDLHTIVGFDAVTEFAEYLRTSESEETFQYFCEKLKEYRDTDYRKIKEHNESWDFEK